MSPDARILEALRVLAAPSACSRQMMRRVMYILDGAESPISPAKRAEFADEIHDLVFASEADFARTWAADDLLDAIFDAMDEYADGDVP